MLKGDGNENGIKISTSNYQKSKFACVALISKDNKFAHAAYFFCTFLCYCFARLKRETSYLQVICMHSPKILLLVFRSLLIFSLPLIFTLLAASISHFLPLRFEWPCFSSYEIRLLCFQ